MATATLLGLSQELVLKGRGKCYAPARLMLEGGCDIYTLSKTMGHTKITTTAIYLSCSNQQMTKAVEMHCLN
jgi:site-specific recombinase XerD